MTVSGEGKHKSAEIAVMTWNIAHTSHEPVITRRPIVKIDMQLTVDAAVVAFDLRIPVCLNASIVNTMKNNVNPIVIIAIAIIEADFPFEYTSNTSLLTATKLAKSAAVPEMSQLKSPTNSANV